MTISYENQRNPILPLDIHIPDSEAHVMFDGRLYLYGSFDNQSRGYCSDIYHVVSTPDMKSWTIHDVSMKGEAVTWLNDPEAPHYPGIDWEHPTPFMKEMADNRKKILEKWAKEHPGETPPTKIAQPLLYAPDCMEHNGKYYLYFCMADESEGVAVSHRPEGPFTDPVQLPCGGIDPAVFKDDDGQVYYYWGQLASHGVKMNPDLMSFDPEAAVHNLVTEEEHYFHEGSSMRKIGDTYYYVYADMQRDKPTALGYATSKSPLGPFIYGGIIIDNTQCDPKSWNNHGSIECVDGQWYIFYHRCSRNTQVHRRLCIEKISILPDGTIPEVKMTSQGIGEPFGPGETIMGYQACGLNGSCYIDTDGAGSEYITNISEGDQMIFRYVKSNASFSEVEICKEGSGKIKIYMDQALCGVVLLENGNASGTTRIHMPAGTYELTLVICESHQLKIRSVLLR